MTFCGFSRFLLLATGIVLIRPPSAAAASAAGEALPVVPLRGLAYTAGDIGEVRRQVRDHGANAALVDGILATAREWTARSDDEVAALVPPADALFAYGSAGDPKTGKAWPRFGRSGNMCSLDRPGIVRSPHTGDLYGNAKPGERYYDSGAGWVRESDGQAFYFKGVWNSWIVMQLHDAVDNLAMAYLLTGDPAFARRGLFILDRLATLRVRLPVTGNSVADWPHTASVDEPKGFFCYMGNIANQRAIGTAYAFDLLANAPFAAAPSVAATSGSPLTVGENITRNYFEIYERRYLGPRFRMLTNHGIIVVANLITQGVLFGNPDMLREGLDGMAGFFDNTINRDGDYMEVSGSYGRLGRDYGSRLVAPLANYDPENYPPAIAAGLPAVGDYTGGLKPGDDPRWFNTAVRMLWRLPVLGRYPQYGDMSMDRAVLLDRDNNWLAKHRAMYLRILYRQTTRADWKREIEALYPRAAAQDASPLLLEDLLVYGLALWMEPATAATSAEAKTETPAGEVSDLMAGKGIAILRSGAKENARALFLRGGINSWHGHDDQMTLVPYGHGMVLFGDYGYRWAGTPDNLGWGTRSISHNAVVVNEDFPAPYLYKGFAPNIPAPAASVTAFLADTEGPAQLVEMRNPQLYTRARLDDYRRAAWLVDVDADRYYFVDVFHVAGGNTHDYAWNSHYIEKTAARATGAAFHVEGIAPVSRPGAWTLASLDNEKNRAAAWNQPGQSWGERLNGENGLVTPLPGEKRLPVSKWNPAPGNGYGMIWNVQAEDTTRDWRAVWPLPDRSHAMRAHLLNYDGMTAVTALGPSMTPENHFNMIIARRTRARNAGSGPLRSRFVNVVEIARPDSWSLAAVAPLPFTTASGDAVGIRAELTAGQTDYLFASPRLQSLEAVAPAGLRFDGRNAFVRIDREGRLVSLALQEGRRLDAAGWKIETATSAIHATVLSVQPGRDASRLVIDTVLPDGLAGSTLLADSATGGDLGYPHNDYYRIEEVSPDAVPGHTVLTFRDQSLVIASLKIEEIDATTGKARLYWNHTLAGKAGNLSYRGRGVVAKGQGADTGKKPVLSLVREIDARDVTFTRTNDLRPGQSVDILVTRPGDRITLPATVTLRAIEGRPRAWRLRSTVPVRVTLPGETTARDFPAGENLVEASAR
ncbi:heparinase [Opitutaceae bacterium TAV5]|nr:heparinase [Opitutaceae bacterium TAV5]